jgi:hypothetical protein
MAINNKHANTLRCGNIKATIRQNVSEKGPFFSTTFSRPFMDQSEAWRNGTSFGLNDLEAIITACDAKEWIASHMLEASSIISKGVSNGEEKEDPWIVPKLKRFLASSSRH